MSETACSTLEATNTGNTSNAQARPQRALSIGDMKRLDVVGITAEDWLDVRTSDITMVTRLVTVLQESLEEMERLATLLDVHLRVCHDPHRAASPRLIRDDELED
jgi:hypothetical protein